VILFMLFYYRGGGANADGALFLNVFLILAAFAAFGFTLTLPGIAGIVLTVGMAVDANVLILERIREELRLGKTVRAAVEAGYERAWYAIRDSNVTTFASGLILFQFGTGPVRGFAVALCVGIITSVLTGVRRAHRLRLAGRVVGDGGQRVRRDDGEGRATERAAEDALRVSTSSSSSFHRTWASTSSA
jgi:protein-export membrane protein SecD